MIVSETAGGNAYTPCPAGSYIARCVRLLDMGTVTTDYQGEAKTAVRATLKPPGTLKKAESIAAWWANEAEATAECWQRIAGRGRI